MKIQSRNEKECLIISVEGNVLQENVPEFQKHLLGLIEKGDTKIILDMGAANYISSMCLATIVEAKNKLDALKKAEGTDGDIKIARANNFVIDLLKVTNLVKKIQTFDSVSDAVAAFA